jgi:conjugative transfer region protein (TIGR03750 family)
VGVIGSVVLGATCFQRIKRNRPDHYYVHGAMRLLHASRLHTFPLVWRSGYWDIDRS